jgi:hypothetical protein
MAYEIIGRLEAKGDIEMLESLKAGLRQSDIARRQKHRVFETSTDLIELFSGKMIEQKLCYMPANPVSKQWRLASDAVEYEHSSFAFYVRGETRGAPLTAFHEFGYLVR